MTGERDKDVNVSLESGIGETTDMGMGEEKVKESEEWKTIRGSMKNITLGKE